MKKMKEFYVLSHDEMIDDGLLAIYGSQTVIDSIYDLIDKYIDSTNDDASNNYDNLLLVLVNEAPEEMQLTIYNKLSSIYDNVYFSDNYEEYHKLLKTIFD